MGSSATTAAGRRRTRKPATRATTRAKAPAKAKPKPRATPKPKARAKPKPKAAAPRVRISAAEKAIAALLVVAMLAAGYWLWFRNSSFAAVEDVAVPGLAGPEAEGITAALTKAGNAMTTLNVDRGALEAAVAGFTTVAGIEASADFPHALTITVRERAPVLFASIGGERVPLAGDGTLLPAVDIPAGSLPEVAVEGAPTGGVVAGEALEMARVAGAAPAPLRELIVGVAWKGEQGVQVKLAGGLPLIFGGASAARAKWDAAAALLADPAIDTLTYVDLRVPERPAVGGAAPAGSQPSTTPLVSP